MIIARFLVLFVIVSSVASGAIAQAFVQNPDQPIEITSDKLEVLQKSSHAIFSGKVKASQGNVNFNADKMHVYYSTKKDKIGDTQSSISRVETSGNVSLITPKEKAKSDTGVFDINKNTIVLSGNVSLTSGKNVVQGDELVYNIKTGKSSIVSSRNDNDTKKQRVKGVFTPNG